MVMAMAPRGSPRKRLERQRRKPARPHQLQKILLKLKSPTPPPSPVVANLPSPANVALVVPPSTPDQNLMRQTAQTLPYVSQPPSNAAEGALLPVEAAGRVTVVRHTIHRFPLTKKAR